MTRRVVVAILFFTVFATSSSILASENWRERPGSCQDAIRLPTMSKVSLDAVLIDWVSPCGFVFVRDPWGSNLVPVYARTAIPLQPYWSINVDGYTLDVGGKRIVVATRIEIYVDAIGEKPFIIYPKDPRGPTDWPYLHNVPLEMTLADEGGGIPTPPNPSPPPDNPLTLTAPEGTIAHSKIEGDGDLTGKVVTSVFPPNGSTPGFFYIEEDNRASGIKVVPQVWVPVEKGAILEITGTVVGGPSVSEVYISASSVRCVGSRVPPGPLYMPGRMMAGGEFGLQQALYLETPAPEKAGNGLSPVGLLVRACGKVTSIRTQTGLVTFYLDEGSGLKCTTDSTERTGIGVIYSTSCNPNYQVDQYVEGVTGALGAEFSDEGLPVPVVRVPCVTVRGVRYVKPGGSGNGLTWGTAYGSVQTAVNDAYLQNPKCEVWVAQGTYLGSNGRVTLKDGVAVYGGFAGTETMREQRDWTTNITILDGGNSGSVVSASSGVTATARIDGFTIRNGFAYGGGISIGSSCSPTVANNTITNNQSSSSGGGISINQDSTSFITWNRIMSNTTNAYGGGIFAYGYSGVIANNEISGNSATSYWSGHGGGICFTYGSPTVLNNTVSGNTGVRYGGGIYYGGGTGSIRLLLEGNIISGNTAWYGGGLCCTTNNRDMPNLIRRNRFDGNAATDDGAALYIFNASADIVDNLFLANVLTTSNGFGGGAIFCNQNNGSPYTYAIVNNTFAKNRTYQIGYPAAKRGGAIYIRRDAGSGTAAILNDIFNDNAALEGQSVYAHDGTNTVAFCDAWNPGANNDAALHYCDRSGDQLSVDGASCIYVDPLFVDTVDYRLQLNIPSVVSPCIDKGNNPGAAPYDKVPTVDFDGLPRPVDIDDLYAPNYGYAAYCDMGAYEAQP